MDKLISGTSCIYHDYSSASSNSLSNQNVLEKKWKIQINKLTIVEVDKKKWEEINMLRLLHKNHLIRYELTHPTGKDVLMSSFPFF